MTDNRKMSLVPPKVSSEDKLKAFIEEPDKKASSSSNKSEPEKKDKTTQKTQYPWEAPGITPEIIKPFVLRLQQPDKLKAEYIVKNSLDYRSLHEYFINTILNQINKDLNGLLDIQE